MTKSKIKNKKSFSKTYYTKFIKLSYSMLLFLSVTWILSEILFFTQKKDDLIKYNHKIKSVIIDKNIRSIIDKIDNKYKNQSYKLQERIKTKANIANQISKNIYENQSLSDTKYKQKLIHSLSNNIPGLFFIGNSKGRTIYQSPGVVRSISDIQKELIVIKEKRKDLISYPSDNKNSYAHTSTYIRTLAYRDWYIGYREINNELKLAKEIKKEVLEYLSNNFLDNKRFIYNTEGYCLYHSAYNNTNKIHYRDTDHQILKHSIENILAATYTNNKCTINNSLIRPDSLEISQVYKYEKWGWLIGFSFYDNNIENIKSANLKNEKRIYKHIAIIFLSLILFIIISKILLNKTKDKFLKDFKNFNIFFTKNTIQSIKFRTTELQYSEFIEIANTVNSIIDKRVNKEYKLKMAIEKAIESDVLKSSFLANMSHEIRTPLNSIMGFSNLLENDGFTKIERAEFCANIKQSGELLLSLITDIIDISRIESGSMNIIFAKTDINQILSDLESTFNKLKKKENKDHIEIIIINNLTEPKINSDSLRLKQILYNIIDNAIKFTEKGSVKIIAENNKNKDILFRVIDTGIGINNKSQKYIFESFYQVENNKSRRYSGTGLGLAISHKLSIMLKGKIWVDSNIDQGSCFYLSIPYIKTSKIITAEQSELIIFD